MFLLDELKDKILTTLVTVYDFTFEEAEEAVNKSIENEEDLWIENTDPDDLAKHLANADDED